MDNQIDKLISINKDIDKSLKEQEKMILEVIGNKPHLKIKIPQFTYKPLVKKDNDVNEYDVEKDNEVKVDNEVNEYDVEIIDPPLSPDLDLVIIDIQNFFLDDICQDDKGNLCKIIEYHHETNKYMVNYGGISNNQMVNQTKLAKYECNFKVGDKVRVIKQPRDWGYLNKIIPLNEYEITSLHLNLRDNPAFFEAEISEKKCNISEARSELMLNTYILPICLLVHNRSKSYNIQDYVVIKPEYKWILKSRTRNLLRTCKTRQYARPKPQHLTENPLDETVKKVHLDMRNKVQVGQIVYPTNYDEQENIYIQWGKEVLIVPLYVLNILSKTDKILNFKCPHRATNITMDKLVIYDTVDFIHTDGTLCILANNKFKYNVPRTEYHIHL